MTNRNLAWIFLLFSGIAPAQPFGAGLKFGYTLNDAIHAAQSVSIPTQQQFVIIGPYIELRLPLGLAVEADALHLYNDVTDGGSPWQFPVLAKYRFLGGPVRPFVEGGPAFSHIFDIAEIPSLNHRSNFGIVVGAGIELKLTRLRISPEIRYNGWALRNFQSPTNLFQSNHNQATFTVGIGF